MGTIVEFIVCKYVSKTSTTVTFKRVSNNVNFTVSSSDVIGYYPPANNAITIVLFKVQASSGYEYYINYVINPDDPEGCYGRGGW